MPVGTRKDTQRFRVQRIIRLLEPLYGPCKPPRDFDGVAELVYTILSQHTSDANSLRAYVQLRKVFPTWDAVVAASPDAVATAVRNGGLARIKAPRIQRVLREIKTQRGAYDLDFLRRLPLREAKAWLLSLDGVGPKTAACVLLFGLGLPAFPVDTHVHRVAKRLGLIGPKVGAEEAHDILERMAGPERVLPFHMYLIAHGRRVCKAQRPRCGQCVLESLCPASVLKRRLPARPKQ